MKNFRLYNRTITDIEKGVFYYEIINGEKDSNNEFIVYKTPIEIEPLVEVVISLAKLSNDDALSKINLASLKNLRPPGVRDKPRAW